MQELSIFIDESGDFGSFCEECPYYIVTLVLHEQKHCIKEQVKNLNLSLSDIGLENHTIHTGPLIRREKDYIHNTLKERYCIFNKLYHFTRNVPIKYKNISVNKKHCDNDLKLIQVISRQLSIFAKENLEYFNQFANIIVYYDNGQIQLTKILISVFGSLFENNVEFRAATPNEYKLFQTADFLCTISLIEEKLINHRPLSNSEKKFFGSERKIKKNYLKHLKILKF